MESKNKIDAIKEVLRKYFAFIDGGPSKKFDPDFSAQDALDEIRQIMED